MIPPLVPLPSSKTVTDNGEKEDLFATLFSPSTPPGSPNPEGVPDNGRNGLQPKPIRHARTTSIDSEFGAFVSVSSTEDPLNQPIQEEVGNAPFSPLQNFEFFDRFAEDAKAATERNRKGVLDELLAHEEDPLYFLHTTTAPGQHKSGASTPVPPPLSSSTQKSLIDLSPTSEYWGSLPLPGEIREREEADAGGSELLEQFGERQSRHPTRQANSTEPARPSILRSPSLPPSPARASLPELQPAQSIFTSSSFSSTAFPTRWVSSLLSRPSTRRTTSVDKAEGLPASGRRTASPPSGGLTSHSRAASGVASPEITHGTPFASEPYVAPSGAPGFSGDRSWNTGGFEFDKDVIEKKSLRLVGRREMTTPVLTAELADMLRPHFPALARLPRSWTLLYSIDQHGISLNTLYTRCESHKGSAVVVMRDSNDALFGTWMGEGIHHSRGSYYGSGESFLWKLLPNRHLRVYKWTGRNDYVALCEPDYISFGGGDGHYGLYLDDTLSDGSSAPCPTFNNEPLCSAGPRQGDNVVFECVGLEVWGVG